MDTPEKPPRKIIYCDNAATTFPKPACVCEAVLDFMRNVGGSPGRSSHALAVRASRVIFEAREALARLFNAPDSGRIVFTSNATEAINLALLGTVRRGELVVVTSMEHNSVMRPLRHLSKTKKVRVVMVPCDRTGLIDVDAFSRAVKDGAALAIVNHASNVCGTIQPIRRLGAVARAHGALFMLDAAQTAGAVPIDVRKDCIDLLAFSGHKSLYGPQGTGGLYIKEGIACSPLKYGGTGSRSDSDSQPDFLPDIFESGPLNGPGIAGLRAGVDFVLKRGIGGIRDHGCRLVRRLREKLEGCNDGLAVYGPDDPEKMVPVISFTIPGSDPGLVARRLHDEYGICLRIGLHCAPNAHRTLGTFPHGTLRLSFGVFNTLAEMDRLAGAIRRCL
jgi:cysteine desulfurase / selenocysteine lyase